MFCLALPIFASILQLCRQWRRLVFYAKAEPRVAVSKNTFSFGFVQNVIAFVIGITGITIPLIGSYLKIY